MKTTPTASFLVGVLSRGILIRFGLPCWAVCASLVLASSAFAAGRPNILMIIVDDLRPQLGCYGETKVRTPNIDRLAAQGLIFNHAYCMVPTCGASRASLLTSIRPAPGRFVNFDTYAEKDAPGIVTLNTQLKRNGYYTVSNGKVFHHPGDNAAGWSEPVWLPTNVVNTPFPGKPEGGEGGDTGAGENRDEDGNVRPLLPYEISPLGDDELADGAVARKTIDDLRRLKDKGQPFFLAAGFYRPHLPFVVPKKYWDLYPAETIQLPSNYYRPKDAPDQSIHKWGELRAYKGVPKEGPLSDEMARTIIRGYDASVSFADAQVGRVLAELDRLDLAKDTIVILFGDHGWNLGEHTLWCKHCCYETSMRVPLILRVPGLAQGQKTDGLVELIDVYPALCEFAGVPIPPHVQGLSFVPLVRDPVLAWKEQAIGRFGNGDTIRTAAFRFTEYSAKQNEPAARMLYDHAVDPAENVNISEQPANAAVVAQLAARLQANKGKRGDLPPPETPAGPVSRFPGL